MKKILVETNVIQNSQVVGTKKSYINLNVSGLTTAEKVYERLYSSNCSESYCYPRRNMRVVSKAHKAGYDAFVKSGGIGLYAKYNRMD